MTVPVNLSSAHVVNDNKHVAINNIKRLIYAQLFKNTAKVQHFSVVRAQKDDLFSTFRERIKEEITCFILSFRFICVLLQRLSHTIKPFCRLVIKGKNRTKQ
jgi:hypothetical protein